MLLRASCAKYTVSAPPCMQRHLVDAFHKLPSCAQCTGKSDMLRLCLKNRSTPKRNETRERNSPHERPSHTAFLLQHQQFRAIRPWEQDGIDQSGTQIRGSCQSAINMSNSIAQGGLPATHSAILNQFLDGAEVSIPAACFVNSCGKRSERMGERTGSDKCTGPCLATLRSTQAHTLPWKSE
jgi:hypothetical protein